MADNTSYSYDDVAAEFMRRYFIPLTEAVERERVEQWLNDYQETPTQICDFLELKNELIRYEQ